MSTSTSLKRPNEETEERNDGTVSLESEPKQIKLQTTENEPNLESEVCVTTIKNLEESIDTTMQIKSAETIPYEGSNAEVKENENGVSFKDSVTIEAIENGSDSRVQPQTEDDIEGKLNKNGTTVEGSPTRNVSEYVCETPNSPSFAFNIEFTEEAIANIYKQKFIQFLKTFSELTVQECGCQLKVFRDVSVGSQSKKRKKHSKAKKELFVLDATPTEDSMRNDHRYTTKFTIGLDEEEEVPVKENTNSKSSCFNCAEKHALKDCPHPKDYNKIKAARQKFLGTKKLNTYIRYHVENEKYPNLSPGTISKELRNALGLREREAPHYVYLMRNLGYPPGWLEEAKVLNSQLDLIDIDGKFLKSAAVKKSGFDESKVVDYPGFNVPFGKGVKDDFRIYHVPPYSDNFNKAAMIDYLARQEAELDACAMDIVREDCIELKLRKAETPPTERNSPSLVDLEQQKRDLLDELNEPKETTKEGDCDSDKEFLAVKTTCFGTPLLKSNSPYSALPKADNFSKDVSPVINFENLPNSTGKYEQLTDVLQKVRDTLKKVQTDSA